MTIPAALSFYAILLFVFSDIVSCSYILYMEKEKVKQ